MAKSVDLDLQKKILELRQQGKGVRQISRELKISPSRVSRALQPSATNEFLRELVHRVEVLEQELSACRECLQIVSRYSVQWGRPWRDELVQALFRWPEGRFKQAYFAAKL
jgi:orotate phosphoribosyltransferase-like protein